MKYWHYFLCGVAVLAVVLSFYFVGIPNNQELPSDNSQPLGQIIKQILPTQWETKTDDQGQVVIQATPVEIGKDAKTWKFAIVLDTHSGSLDEDMVKTSLLSDEQGNVYQPIAWEGSPPGGHHREGVLVFDALEPVPFSVELKIKGVGGVAERSFTWKIK